MEQVSPQPAVVRRSARLLVITTLLLLGVGGLVTTYRVGMAVHDWPTTFGSTMFAYPLSEMLQSWGVTLEHGHRMLGSLVGLLTLVVLVTTALRAGRGALASVLAGLALEVAAVARLWAQRASSTGEVELDWSLPALPFAAAVVVLLAGLFAGQHRGLRSVAVLAHLAVVGQGLLGGTRVLENSQHLAFLHGTSAQVVFVVIAVVATLVGPVRAELRAGATSQGRSGPIALAAFTTLLVLAQSTLGAWTRHTGGHMPAGIHALTGLLVVGAVLLLSGRVRAQGAAIESPSLTKAGKGLLHLVFAQFILGVAALVVIFAVAGGFEGPVTVTEAVVTALHVVTGALLAASCARAGILSASVPSTAVAVGKHSPADLSAAGGVA